MKVNPGVKVMVLWSRRSMATGNKSSSPRLAYAWGVQRRWEPEPDNNLLQVDAECKPSAHGTDPAACTSKCELYCLLKPYSARKDKYKNLNSLTRDLLSLQTSHGKETVDEGPSQWCPPSWDLLADCLTPKTKIYIYIAIVIIFFSFLIRNCNPNISLNQDMTDKSLHDYLDANI